MGRAHLRDKSGNGRMAEVESGRFASFSGTDSAGGISGHELLREMGGGASRADGAEWTNDACRDREWTACGGIGESGSGVDCGQSHGSNYTGSACEPEPGCGCTVPGGAASARPQHTSIRSHTVAAVRSWKTRDD